MNNKIKNILIVLLCAVIAGSLGLTAYTVSAAKASDEPNPNVTLVTTPDQTGFEVHEEWTIPVTEPIDYGENLALEKTVRQSGQTDIYNCKNVNDGDRYTYWEGESDDYPNEITMDMDAPTQMTGARILLNPRQIWGPRTQIVEVQVSEDGENFTTVYEKATLSFDPMTDNSVYMEFAEAVQAQYIRFLFHANTGAKGGQAAEIEVYGP